MKVKIKKLHEDAVIPSYAHSTDAGLDLTAISIDSCAESGNITYGTGLAIEIPVGYVGLLFPRSSISKQDMCLTNSVGVIDSGYRGEIMFKFKHNNALKTTLATIYAMADSDYLPKDDCKEILSGVKEKDVTFKNYEVGDRIGQLLIIPYPSIEFDEVDELSESDRGVGKYGSTGN